MSGATGTALLVMDFQNGIVSRISTPGLLERTKSAIDAARKASIPVIYVVVRFRDGFPEVSPNNQSFSQVKSGGFDLGETSPSTQVHADIAPVDGEVVIVKRRVGAFSGSDLDVVLRAQGINHLVLSGISTSGVVLSTLRLAADLDYRLTVLADCCADPDEEVHRVLTEKVFPRQATVTTAAEWAASIG